MQTAPEEELIRLLKFGTARRIRDFISSNPTMDLHYPSAQLTSPLLAAIERSEPATLAGLIDRLPGELDATLTYPCARTALMRAAYGSGNPEILHVLVRKGADPGRSDMNGWNALYHAVVGRRLENVDALLDYQVPVESRDREGRSPLMVSVYLSSAEIFERLLGRGADVDALDRHGLSGLHLAILRRRRDCVLGLARRGARFELVTPFSRLSTRELAEELMADLLPVRRSDDDDDDDDDEERGTDLLWV